MNNTPYFGNIQTGTFKAPKNLSEVEFDFKKIGDSPQTYGIYIKKENNNLTQEELRNLCTKSVQDYVTEDATFVNYSFQLKDNGEISSGWRKFTLSKSNRTYPQELNDEVIKKLSDMTSNEKYYCFGIHKNRPDLWEDVCYGSDLQECIEKCKKVLLQRFKSGADFYIVNRQKNVCCCLEIVYFDTNVDINTPESAELAKIVLVQKDEIEWDESVKIPIYDYNYALIMYDVLLD